MKKLQAAMRDRAAKRIPESYLYYKVGSCFKGCHHCGEFECEDGSSRKRYTSGFNVFRSYYPCRTKWTYWCWDCSATDEAAWEGAADIGRDAIRGSKEAIKNAKKRLRRENEGERPEAPTRGNEIEALKSQIAAVELMLARRTQ